MKRTIQGIAIGVVGCMLIALGSAAMMTEARNEALRNKIEWLDAQNFDLTIKIVALRTTENNCKVLEYVLPQVCISELSRISHKINQLERTAR